MPVNSFKKQQAECMNDVLDLLCQLKRKGRIKKCLHSDAAKPEKAVRPIHDSNEGCSHLACPHVYHFNSALNGCKHLCACARVELLLQMTSHNFNRQRTNRNTMRDLPISAPGCCAHEDLQGFSGSQKRACAAQMSSAGFGKWTWGSRSSAESRPL